MLDMNPLEKSRSLTKLCQPPGQPGRDDAQGVLTPRIIYFSQHTLKQFSALFPVFSGMFLGGSSKVALPVVTVLYQLQEAGKSCGSSCAHAKSLHTVAQK